METLLEQANSAVARQRNEIEELRSALDARDARVEAALATLEASPAPEAQLSAALEEMDRRRESLARELHDRVTAATRGQEVVGGLAERVERLEEGSEAARIRMRLERIGHQLQALEVRVATLEEGTEEFRRIEERIEAQDEAFRGLSAAFSELTEELTDLRRSSERSQPSALRERIEDVEGLALKACTLVETGRSELEEKLARLEALASHLGELGDGSASDARFAALEQRLDHTAAELERERERASSATEALRALISEHASSFESLNARVRSVEDLSLETASGLEAAHAAAIAANQSGARGAPGGDDLTRIRGIGPKFARLLRDLGVTQFSQIASWSEADVEAYAERLGVRPSRIQKAGWVASAASLRPDPPPAGD